MIPNQQAVDLSNQGLAQIQTPPQDLPLVETLNVSGNQINGFGFLKRLPNLKVLIANNVPSQPLADVRLGEIETNVILNISKPPHILRFTKSLQPFKVLTSYFAELNVATRSKVTIGLLKFHYQDGQFMGKRATSAPVQNCPITISYVEYAGYYYTLLLEDTADLKYFARGYKMKNVDSQRLVFLCIKTPSGFGVFAFKNDAFLETSEALAMWQSENAQENDLMQRTIDKGYTGTDFQQEFTYTLRTLPNSEASLIQATETERKVILRPASFTPVQQRETSQMRQIPVGKSIENAKTYLTQCETSQFLRNMSEALQIGELHAESLLLQLKPADFGDSELKIEFHGREFVVLMGRKNDQFREDEIGHLCFAATGDSVTVMRVVGAQQQYVFEKFQADDEVTAFRVGVERGVVCFVYFNGALYAELASGEKEVPVAGGVWRIVFVQDGAVIANEEIIG